LIKDGTSDICVQCPPGNICSRDVEASTAQNIIITSPCPEGFYCEVESSRIGTPCPDSTLGLDESSETLAQCSACPSGSFCAGLGQLIESGGCDEGRGRHWLIWSDIFVI
jgi:hypothetical protein